MRTLVAGVWAALSVSVAVGCAGRAPVPVTETSKVADPCLVIPPPAVPLDTVTVIVEERGYPSDSLLREMSAGALATPSTSPAFALAQVYEPLVRVTCDGRIGPALADRWWSDVGGQSLARPWVFSLRPDARFANGDPVTAQTVVSDWSRRHLDDDTVAFPLLRGVATEGERIIRVGIRDSVRDGPALFAHPVLAVGGRDRSGTWVPGTGAYVPDTTASTAEQTVLTPAVPGALPTLIVRARGKDDERDLLDAGVDILETRNPSVVDYARRNDAFTVYALPWDRTYALTIPIGSGPAVSAVPGIIPSPEAAALREALARDAVRADSRPAQRPEWWEGPPCWLYPPRRGDFMYGRPAAAARRLEYDATDPIARALAERIVAIARDSRASVEGRQALALLAPALVAESGDPVSATPVERLGYANMNLPTAYILALPSRTVWRCLAEGEFRLAHSWGYTENLFPLVESRSFLIARRGAPAVSVDWEGTLRVHPSPR